MAIKIVPFEPEHLEKIDLRDSDRESRIHLIPVTNLPNFYIFTGLEDDEILGIGGICLGLNNEAQAFMALSDSATQKPVRFTLLVKRQLDKLIEEHQVKKLRVWVDNRYLPQRFPWIIWMGFKNYEGAYDGWTEFSMNTEKR